MVHEAKFLLSPIYVYKPRGLYFSKDPFERLIFGGAYIRRGLSTEGKLRFKIDWASRTVGRKFIVFAMFYFVFEGTIQGKAPRGLITEGFLRCECGGLIFGGTYSWRDLFSEFHGICVKLYASKRKYFQTLHNNK